MKAGAPMEGGALKKVLPMKRLVRKVSMDELKNY